MKRSLHALIVDDTSSDITLFEFELAKVIPDFPFTIRLSKAHSCAEAIDIINNSPKFDFAILDYQLDGMNIFQLLKITSTQNLGIPVLTTSPKSLPLGEIYSIKPTPMYLEKTYDGPVIRSFLKELQRQIRNIDEERDEEFIVIDGTMRERVKYKNIYFFESPDKGNLINNSRNHSEICYKSDNGEVIIKKITGNLNAIHKQLKGSLFIRASRYSIVNIDNISRCDKSEQVISFFINSREYKVNAVYSSKYPEFMTLMFEMRLIS